ncbi:hypothetical protein E2C01_037156 [Portunus trituberculatus]|uniref:Uncharacterized protein n=1 Tax=Portunus trituberculatus TaxID=210409 RepID=A0A5B7FD80_PORTR|nr:hypothetical protein [Portunus trituberculatus]
MGPGSTISVKGRQSKQPIPGVTQCTQSSHVASPRPPPLHWRLPPVKLMTSFDHYVLLPVTLHEGWLFEAGRGGAGRGEAGLTKEK